MLNLVEKFLKKYIELDNKKTVLIGFSGGADSLCLSDVIIKLSEKYGFKVVLCHLNHNWRGEHSKADMEYCIDFAKSKNVIIETKTLSESEKQTETNARELRYEFFEDCIKKYDADAFLLAHNKNDRAETLVYRLIKGAGIKGLASISEKRDKFLRPLINVTRQEIEEYCKNNGLNYVTDNSNFDTKYNRNYVRCEILPLFEKINPEYLNSIVNLSNIAEDTENILNEYVSAVLKNISDNDTIKTQKFDKLSEALKKRVLINILEQNEIEYSTKKISEILEFYEQNKNSIGIKYSLSNDLWLLVSDKSIEVISKVEKNNTEIKITKEGEYELNNYVLKIEKFNGDIPNSFPKDIEMKAYVELQEPYNLTFRTRRDGDIIQPLGIDGTQKLNKYLNEKKIKNHIKDNLVFLCNGNEVLWCPMYGLNNKIKVVNKVTHMLSLSKKD